MLAQRDEQTQRLAWHLGWYELDREKERREKGDLEEARLKDAEKEKKIYFFFFFFPASLSFLLSKEGEGISVELTSESCKRWWAPLQRQAEPSVLIWFTDRSNVFRARGTR